MLKRSALALSAALGLLGMSALTTAHAGFVSATPAPGSNLQVAPTEVRVTFGAELDPDGSRFTVTDAAGGRVGIGTVDLSVADRNVLAGTVAIGRPGLYTVRWTSLSTDGDGETGTFSFGVRINQAVPTTPGGGSSADTSVAPRPTHSWSLLLLGALLLLAGAATLARRLALR